MSIYKSNLQPPFPTLLIPELQPSLLTQDSIHGTAIQTLTRICPSSFHVLLCYFQPRQLDIMVLGHGSGMFCVLDGKGDAESGMGV